MFNQFLDPDYLAAGAALISLPILLQLIKRMRFNEVTAKAIHRCTQARIDQRRVFADHDAPRAVDLVDEPDRDALETATVKPPLGSGFLVVPRIKT